MGLKMGITRVLGCGLFLSITLILGILGGIGRFEGSGSYSPRTKKYAYKYVYKSKYIKQAHHLSYLYQGGGDYRGYL
jgi:hypothetical protein